MGLSAHYNFNYEKSRISLRQILGELLLTAGAVLLLFVFYEAYWINVESGKLQEQAQEQLDETWQNPRKQLNPKLGEAFARMYIPAFGEDFQFAIVEGTDDNDLLRGPGRYEQTQRLGEENNFGVSGHRVGKGSPLNDLGSLETCDAIVVETQTAWVTYRVLPIAGDEAPRLDCLSSEQQDKLQAEYSHVQGRHITVPGDVSVLDPVPSLSDAIASEGILTLTTCHPQFSNAERMIIHAMEVENLPKTAGATNNQRPAALEETA